MNRATIRGVVLDKQKRPLSWVQVWCDDRSRYAQQTGADGRFTFEDVVAPCNLVATLLGTPASGPKPDVIRRVAPGDADLTLIVDRGFELRVHVDGVQFPGGETTRAASLPAVGDENARFRLTGVAPTTTESMSYGPTRLYLQTSNGWSSWYAAVENGSLAFRRVKPGLPWVLFVGWSKATGGTCLCSGEALTPANMSVRLQIGGEISGTATLPPPPAYWAGPPRDTVVARRGPVEVPGWVHARSGTFGFAPLPLGRWAVELRSGRMRATIETDAGTTHALEPK